ncbi:hypothetical protein ScPMuIL_007599 [Solemya velum]
MESRLDESLEDIDSDVIEIIPMDEYDSQKAKLKASLSWILHKAYKDEGVPAEFRNPFYKTQEGVFHVKPRLANILSTSELYCQACCNLFSHSSSQWQGHWSIIQVLSRKGIYVMQSDDLEVTETVLMKTSPFNVSAHLALIDALMKAYVSEVVSIEKVVQAVRRFAVFNASSELPSNHADALIFWINKVCTTLQQRLDREQKTPEHLQGETNQKVRIVSQSQQKDKLIIPIIENILEDITDGCSLASLINFYCPETIKIQDICLKSNVGIADSLYNLKLVRTFCETHLPVKSFHLTYEDLLYTRHTLTENLMVLLAEMFYWFEVCPISCVFSPTDVSKPVCAKNTIGVRVPQIPISNVTKQSFHKSADARASPGMDFSRACAGVPIPVRQPLLHRRHQNKKNGHEEIHSEIPHASVGNKPFVPSASDGIDAVHQSVLAWQENEPQEKAQEKIDLLLKKGYESSDSNMLANVSIDSEMNESFSADVTSSIDISDLDDTPPGTRRSAETEKMPSLNEQIISDHLELESVTPVGHSTHRSSKTDRDVSPKSAMEPLVPARLKPAKEKVNNHTKAEERGDVLKRKVESPKERISVGDSSENVEVVTPLPEEPISMKKVGSGDQCVDVSQQKGFAAFVINPNSSVESPRLGESRSDTSSRDEETKESYVVDEHIYTVESAIAAGIPVIGDATDHNFPKRSVSREGSIASSRSSGDFSDHESRKIHYDHKTRESKEMTDPSYRTDLTRPETLGVSKPLLTMTKSWEKESASPKHKTLATTNFAEIKKMKGIGHVDNSGLIYMLHGQEKNGSPDQQLSLKDTFQQRKVIPNSDKKTTFAALPNQTTWQEQSGSRQEDDFTERNGVSSVPTQSFSSELMKIRMKLEEKRKMIEHKKHRQELQQVKMRQRLGKAAFLHVVSKPKEEDREDMGDSVHGSDNMRSRIPPGSQNSMDQSASGSVSEDLNSAAQPKRPFSRDDIQQTIENVKKKWFKDETLVPTSSQHNQSVEDLPVSEAQKPTRTESPRPVSRAPVQSSSPQSVSQVHGDVDKSGQHQANQPENYGEYNTSLDKLNKSLSDLQGEIMKMSLQKGVKVLQDGRSKSPSQTVRVSATEGAGLVKASSDSDASQSTGPRVQEYASGELHHVSNVNKSQSPAFHLQSSLGRSGQPYTGQNQFIPTCPGMPPQYGGYMMEQQQTYGMQPYNPNQPPQLFPQSPSYPQQFPPQPMHMQLTSPPQPYVPPVMSTGSYQSPIPPYLQQPFSQVPVAVQQPHPSTTFQLTPTSVLQSSSTNLHQAGVYKEPTEGLGSLTSQLETASSRVIPVIPETHTPPRKQWEQLSKPTVGPTETVSEPSGYVPHPQYKETSDLDFNNTTETKLQDEEDSSQLDSTPSGFFVSFNNDTPVKPKPKKLGKERAKKDIQTVETVSHRPVVTSQGPNQIQPNTVVSSHTPVKHADEDSITQNLPGVGFVIGTDHSNEQVKEDEMQKKKDKLIQMQLKRQEDQERKRQEKETELNKIREQERQKQEDAERRKLDEKARREIIFKQYMEKKLEKEEDETPDRRPSRTKPRPKSMFVRAKALPSQNHSLTSHGSNDNLSPHGSPGSSSPAVKSRKTVPKGRMRKAVSCNTLAHSDADGRSLMYGGYTHRRPPSPDLLGVRRGKGSNDSSETGSCTGSDYSGPKLFVKPSSKSNRSIIINALSHCCLAGIVNTDMKNKVLEEVARADAKHFVILFRDGGCQFKGLYRYEPDVEEVLKIYGVGPKQLTNKMIEKFYKYNCGAKNFTEVQSTKHLSVSIDAVVILNALWKSNKLPPARR